LKTKSLPSFETSQTNPPNDTVSHPKKPEPSATPLTEPQISHNSRLFFVVIPSFVFITVIFFPIAQQPLRGLGLPQYRSFTITLRHTTLRRTPLDEWSARRSNFYLTTHNTQRKQISMPLGGFEPTIPASERPQTHALDGAPTGIGLRYKYLN
jgi:hypothetical protein